MQRVAAHVQLQERALFQDIAFLFGGADRRVVVGEELVRVVIVVIVAVGAAVDEADFSLPVTVGLSFVLILLGHL